MDCNELGRMKDMLEQIYPVGFVIEVGEKQYFRMIRRKRIYSTSVLCKAKYYSTYEKAEADIWRYLKYVGLNPYICRVCWTLIYTESLEDKWHFWNGNTYSMKEQEAVRFSSYDKAVDYQRINQLQYTGMIEHYCFRDKQILFAA